MTATFNTEIELVVKANSLINPISPKKGMLSLGEKGIEFLAVNGIGFIQIPWENIVVVKAHVLFHGRYIRGFDVYTDDQQMLSFVTSNTKQALIIMREHLGSDKLRQANNNFKSLLNRKKHK
ncbi:DUF956 family protein [Vagococcus intermedius]|uniref:DUF956 family protein n=1 Tax=Vagococcus intermedius TaxID=2991418 RepID=A0AAF0CVD4_9ENTE|nr:DUF956 family protein [Vagococcus intermedius]WEG73640.1 DUF956 family protein [Vagococcus intermedius]WEG75724.1 DUF956 family protein [Vagococcus intermedius]